MSPSIRFQIFSHTTYRFAFRENQGNANIYNGAMPSLILNRFNQSRDFYYFNKGTDDLKKLNYINLKRNLNDNIDSRRIEEWN